MIEYKRGQKDQTDLSNRTTWESRCGRYKIEEYKNKFEVRYRAFYNDLCNWNMLQHLRTYRTKTAAMKACEKFNASRSK
jgi:hypothetical protein